MVDTTLGRTSGRTQRVLNLMTNTGVWPAILLLAIVAAIVAPSFFTIATCRMSFIVRRYSESSRCVSSSCSSRWGSTSPSVRASV